MITILIASYKEPNTIGKAIESFLDQEIKDLEIIVVAPDKETLEVASKYEKVQIIKEKEKLGKPAALNLGLKYVNKKSNILVLSDGDVFVSKQSLNKLISHFKDPKIGAVTGRPISRDSRKNKYGFWSHVLTSVAHIRRKRSTKKRKRFFCSGYLFAIRKSLFPKLPNELLSEDGYISHKVYEKKYIIKYEPEAKVFVNYPKNFEDWIKQKRRSAGGYNQIKSLFKTEIRSFGKESLGGLNIFDFLKSVSTPKELFWLIQLYIFRIYLWALIYRDINIRKKNLKEIWVPIKSTK